MKLHFFWAMAGVAIIVMALWLRTNSLWPFNGAAHSSPSGPKTDWTP